MPITGSEKRKGRSSYLLTGRINLSIFMLSRGAGCLCYHPGWTIWKLRAHRSSPQGWRLTVRGGGGASTTVGHHFKSRVIDAHIYAGRLGSALPFRLVKGLLCVGGPKCDHTEGDHKQRYISTS